MHPSDKEFWFLPLGGCGEIGMNLNLYGHNDQWLMVDCGVSFEDDKTNPNGSHTKLVMPDPSFIAQHKDHLIGLVITHAHEDHIGAVAHLWPRLQCPVYTTAYSAEILRQKLREKGLDGKVPIRVVEHKASLALGPFQVEWISLTHSIVEAYGLIIECPLGKVFHTADWKLDPQPQIGYHYPAQRYQNMANENILAMVCDSTNATKLGHSNSELQVKNGLQRIIGNCKNRVVVTCFGSNIARLQSLYRIAEEQGRYMGVLGRSMHQRINAAKLCDWWPHEDKLIDIAHTGYLPKNEVLIAATGSQGEPRTALQRLADQRHPALELEAGDTVIFSSMTIPGNEAEVTALVKKLKAMGVEVIQMDECDEIIHASGHPCQDELKTMYEWVKPEIAIPVHGEEIHMQANAEQAKLAGVKRQLCGLNGDLFLLAPQIGVRRQFAKAGKLVLKQ